MKRLILITGLVGTQKYGFGKRLTQYLNGAGEPTAYVSMHNVLKEICDSKQFTNVTEYFQYVDEAINKLVDIVRRALEDSLTVVCVGEFKHEHLELFASCVKDMASVVLALEAEDFESLRVCIQNILTSESMDLPELSSLYCDEALLTDMERYFQLYDDWLDIDFGDRVLKIPNRSNNEPVFYAILQLVKLYHNRNPTI